MENICPYCGSDQKIIHEESYKDFGFGVEVFIECDNTLAVNTYGDTQSNCCCEKDDAVSEISFSFPIKYCPICGRELENKYNNELENFDCKDFMEMQNSSFNSWYEVTYIKDIHNYHCKGNGVKKDICETVKLRLDNVNGWGDGVLFFKTENNKLMVLNWVAIISMIPIKE